MIIGISGKARSGKDQFAAYLASDFLEEHDRRFFMKAFANELKEMCAKYFELSHDQLYGDRKEMPDLRYPKDLYGVSSNPNDYWTSREIMQEIGSFFRKIDYDFWVKRLASKAHLDCIITDVRHVNECEYIKNNGVLIRIIRPDTDEIHGMEHESETALDDKPDDYFDIIVENSGTLKELYETAHEVASAVITMNELRNQGRVIENG